MVRPRLQARNGKLWITYNTAANWEAHRLTHRSYQCPLCRRGCVCMQAPRSDKQSEKHKCDFIAQGGLPKLLKSYTVPIVDDTRGKENAFYEAVIKMMAKCNMSFRAIRSDSFRDFVEAMQRIFGPGGEQYRDIIPSLSYETVVSRLQTIALEKQNSMINCLRGQTVTIMLDGGMPSGEPLTAVTILPHNSTGHAYFFNLEPACSTAEDYRSLAIRLQKEMEKYDISVVSYCTDGLYSQKSALTKSPLPVHSNFPINTFWIYCCNHLTNLVLVHSIKENIFLKEATDRIISFSAEVRRSKSKLKAICPSYSPTRWLSLGDISRYIVNYRDEISAQHLLTYPELATVALFHCIIEPLHTMQLLLEQSTTRLGNVFQIILNACFTYSLILNNPNLQTQHVTAIRVILTWIYDYFLSSDRGNLIGLAFFLTPSGLVTFHKTKFLFQEMCQHFENLSHLKIEPLPHPIQDIISLTKSLQPEPQLKTSFIQDCLLQLEQDHPASASPSVVELTEDRYSTYYQIQNSCTKARHFVFEQMKVTDELTKKAKEGIQYAEQTEKQVPAAIAPQQAESGTSPGHTSSSIPSTVPSYIEEDDEDNDLLGLLDATMKSANDEFKSSKETSERSSSIITRSAKLAGSNGELITIDDDDDDVIIIEPPEVKERRLRNKLLCHPPAQSKQEEMEMIDALFKLISADWESRLTTALNSLIQEVMPTIRPQTATKITAEFDRLLHPSQRLFVLSDATAFYKQRSLINEPGCILSYMALNLIRSPCSESSCERVFSLAKWIAGTRRRRLQRKTLSLLLHIIY